MSSQDTSKKVARIVTGSGIVLQGPQPITTPEPTIWEYRRASRLVMETIGEKQTKKETVELDEVSTIMLAVRARNGGEK